MGNAQSPPADPRFSSASRAFTPKKLEDLRSLFVSLAAQSESEGRFVSRSVFQTYFQLRGSLGDSMFDFITQKRKDEELTFEDLIIAKATYEKGTGEEIEQFIYQILDVNGDGSLGRSDLESVLVTMFDNIFDTKNSTDGLTSRSSQDVVPLFLDTAHFSSNNSEGHCEDGMSFEDLRSWFTLVPSARKFLGNLLVPPNHGRPGWQVPRLLYGENINTSMILLKEEYAWHIGGALSEQEQEEWKLLYHSSLHGFSFSTFLGNITNKDKTILLIKDKEGHVFGGYASQPWEKRGDFYGDMKSFIFQLHPEAAIFRPTGLNRNVQWCAVNFTSEDIPNGMGFGGRVNHFGLFISASFDQGQTFECTTFGSPCLAGSSRVQPEVIECWEVVQGTEHQKQDIVRGTVLERFKEDRHMLNMVGLANASE